MGTWTMENGKIINPENEIWVSLNMNNKIIWTYDMKLKNSNQLTIDNNFKEKSPDVLFLFQDNKLTKKTTLTIDNNFKEKSPNVLFLFQDDKLMKKTTLKIQNNFKEKPPKVMWMANNKNIYHTNTLWNYLGCGHNSYIEEINFPLGLQEIGDYSFNQSLLTEVKIPTNCKYNANTTFPIGCKIIKE